MASPKETIEAIGVRETVQALEEISQRQAEQNPKLAYIPVLLRHIGRTIDEANSPDPVTPPNKTGRSFKPPSRK
jgi:hypothetical protein